MLPIEVLDQIDAVAENLLEQSGVTAPPVDAWQIGSTLQIIFAWDASQTGRGRTLRHGGQAMVLLRPDQRRERRQWAAAHEIGETLAGEIFLAAGLECADIEPPHREYLANQFAQRLLIPTLWWQDQVDATDRDLWSLKKVFSTASHELVAGRLLDLTVPRVMTVWDQGELTRRRCNRAHWPRRLTPTEIDVWQRSHREQTFLEVTSDEGRLRCWPISEPGWQREILLWEPRLMNEESEWL